VTLVDTSIWIAVFAREKPLELERVLDFEEAATCLPVVQEVLQGFRAESAYRTARDALMEESLFLESRQPITARMCFAAPSGRLGLRSTGGAPLRHIGPSPRSGSGPCHIRALRYTQFLQHSFMHFIA